MNKKLRYIYILSIIFLIIDQFIKILLSNIMKLNDTLVIIKNFFSITLVHNTGAAFSILSGNLFLLILIGLITVMGISYYINKENNINKLYIIIYSLLFGGILGNLIDRIIHGYVIDYLSFKFGKYYFPVFNLADIFIVISAILIILSSIKEEVWKS